MKQLLGRKGMTNLGSILKCRDITLPTKVCLVKAMVFPVVMYGCESYTIKKTECCRIDAFELWYWRRLLRVLWTARRSNWSILKEISPVHPTECTTTRVNPVADYRLRVMMWQCRFISYKKCSTLMRDVDNEGSSSCWGGKQRI